MSEWTRPAQPVRCVVELDKPLAVHRERGVLAQGDANANAIVAEVYSTAGKPYDLSGCTVQLIFVRPDNNALPAINAEISGNTATATLPDSAYAMSGMYSLRMQLRKNGAERTIVWNIGEVKGTDVDGIADPEHVISIGDIMASAKEAQTAASTASAAAKNADEAAASANKAAENTTSAILEANEAVDAANAAAARIDNMTVDVEMLNPSEAPSAEVEQTALATNVLLRIPKSNLAYATFEVDNNMMLLMHAPEDYGGIAFALNDNGKLEVRI